MKFFQHKKNIFFTIYFYYFIYIRLAQTKSICLKMCRSFEFRSKYLKKNKIYATILTKKNLLFRMNVQTILNSYSINDILMTKIKNDDKMCNAVC